MKKHACKHSALVAVLVAALSLTCIPAALALAKEDAGGSSSERASGQGGVQAESTAAFQKTEVVYATLSADGAPEAAYVVNRFDVEAPGTVADHGDYAAVQNLTNQTVLERVGDATVFQADEGTLYYQGDAAGVVLPWRVAVSYELDGKKVSADQLVGASGNLAVQVATARNKQVDPAFYDSFMMQITFTLPGGVATDVAAEGATVASAGQDTTVAFTVLPGHDGDFALTAKVRDFHMAGAQIAALPYASVMEMPDTAAMTDGMTSLSSAVSQLADGTASLASGVDRLTGGARDLSSGAAAFGEGLNRLDGSSAALVDASAQVKSALEAVSGGLAQVDLSQLDQVEQLPATFRQMADGLAQLREAAAQAQRGYDAALAALGSAVAGIPEGSLTQGQIAALAGNQATQEDRAAVAQLAETYQAAQAVKAAYADAGIQAAFEGASRTLATLGAADGALSQQEAALRAVADQLDAALGSGQLDQVKQLVGGLSQLSGQYGQFHEGLVQYASGLSALAVNYSQLEAGTAQLANGTGQLASGAGQLSSGMGQLNAATITLPDTMKKQIADMMADYDFPEFNPVSFMSPENKNVKAVQFVMTTAAIEQPEAPQEEEPQPQLTLWDRFLALFQG